ncbi:MAG TPA: RNA 2',3'-cyclic phosphodiesterase [Clostridiales bacterium]|jgi:2'-5' RNA ligase|nr:RNA 2',3'-cyclic phosphodiesterase [Clostridiales bacterium]HCG34873.1 RNA 2',3'-cyclic phosphodiesterase [Clostridiales bacterium]
MRLFIAIDLSDEMKDELEKSTCVLKTRGRGRFPLRENYHLTLVFLGKTNRVNDIKKAMDMLETTPFDLKLSSCGRFQREGGDVVWAGIEKNPILENLVYTLTDNLRNMGFSVENRPYKAHITLAREMEQVEFPSIKPLSMTCHTITLMESLHIGRELKYLTVYDKNL